MLALLITAAEPLLPKNDPAERPPELNTPIDPVLVSIDPVIVSERLG